MDTQYRVRVGFAKDCDLAVRTAEIKRLAEQQTGTLESEEETVDHACLVVGFSTKTNRNTFIEVLPPYVTEQRILLS